jgi:hypothetical protein
VTRADTFDLRLRVAGGGDVRAVTGARLEIERRNRRLPVDDRFEHEDIGAGWACDGFSLDALDQHAVLDWDLEVGEPGPGAERALRAAVAGLLPAEAVDELVELSHGVEDDPMPWHAEWVPPVGPGLREQGAAWFDVLVPSVNWRRGDCTADPVTYFRHARLVWAPHWCVVLWGARTGGIESDYLTWGLPDRPPISSAVAAHDGEARLAPVLRAILAHVEWSIGMVDVELECWETDFLEQAATKGGVFVGPDLSRLQRQLAGLGRGVSYNQDAIRTLVRRSAVQGFPADVRRAVNERCQEFMNRSQDQRRTVRESFDLIASATAGQQFRLAQQRADRDALFYGVVSTLAAIFVGPGLIAAFYGANVKGLPGYDSEIGLWFMLGGAVLATTVSLLLLATVRSLARRRALEVPEATALG